MKILFIASGGHLYGDNKSLLQTLIAMKDYIEPLVCIVQEGLMAEELKINNIRYVKIRNTMCPHRLKLGETRYFYRLSRFPFYFIRSVITYSQILKYVKVFHPDIIHSNNGFIYAGCIVSKKMKIPHVWHLREYIDKDHGMKVPRLRYFKNNIERSYCIAVSKGVFKHWSLKEKKDVVIYDGIFARNELLPYSLHKGNYFLFSGRLIETKGVKELVKIFIEFSKCTSSSLLIAGEGDDDYVKSIKDMVANANLENRIIFMGFVKDIRDLMANAKALIVPSYFEAQGRITAEALLLGCFVIGKNTGGTKELLEINNSGILYDTEEELMSALKRVDAMNECYLANLNIKAKENSMQNFLCEVNAKNMYDFYKSVINKN